jgi:hypothetical protein
MPASAEPSPPETAPETVDQIAATVDAVASVEPWRPGLCLDCDYALHGLPADRCPECGRAFELRDRTTMNMGLPLGRIGRWMLRPIGWPTYVCALTPTAWVLWQAIDPQLYYMFAQYFLAAVGLLLMKGIHFTWSFTKLGVARSLGQPLSIVANDRRRWRRLWRVAAFGLLLVVFKVPMRLGFLISQRALNALAQEVLDNPKVPIAPDRRVGLYTVASVYHDPKDPPSVVIRLNPSQEGGFAYSPAGAHHFAYNAGDSGRLWDQWYWFSED